MLGRKELRYWGGTGTGRYARPGGCLMVCLPPQSSAELEDKVAAFLGQKAERAGEGAGYQVGITGLPQSANAVGWACHQERRFELCPFGSLSSGEEEEGKEEEKKEKKMSPRAAADEVVKEEEEEVELALAEMKAKELAELKR